MDAALFFLGTALVAVAYALRSFGRRPKGLPPGPPTLPIIGNLHLMPPKAPHHQFKKWADEYGPIYSLIMGPSSVMIVLTSDTAIKDLLDKRSSIYSSRQEMYIGQLLSGGHRMLLMQYGDTWRMIRRTVHNHLNIRAAKSYIPYQDLENRQMLVGFLDKPERWDAHLRRYTNSLTTQMIFGFRTTDIDDKKLHQLYDGFAKFSETITSPASRIIDVIPVLRHLPDFLFPVKKLAKKLHEKELELFLGHWLNVKAAVKNGTANPCVCVDLIKSQQVEGFSDNLASYISGSLLEAGSDTTSSTLIGWVQAMVLFPDVAKAAQKEIDSVCGDRFPMLEDEPNLQYVRACAKESMRWMPTAILGVPHAAMRDDEYLGYRIPKGAGVMWNVWGIHHDEKRFPNARVFDPTRYANDRQSSSEAALNGDATQRDHFLFGAGRRVCQGMHIADRSLFLAISRLLWAFEFHPVEDAAGNKLLPNPDDLTEGLLVQPKPFSVRIVPRSLTKEEIVRKEWADVGEFLNEEGQWKKVPDEIKRID
ncbi:cytochrome P450 [Dendryphion nanum]|uniref:Cytochrome P450 n=1 Tax=Dendryphion nanum TaxID=256645 RepID=A0A9P9E1C8_9PLEO|nr:cytochrome P450 [Dendryphion nanum]